MGYNVADPGNYDPDQTFYFADTPNSDPDPPVWSKKPTQLNITGSLMLVLELYFRSA